MTVTQRTSVRQRKDYAGFYETYWSRIEIPSDLTACWLWTAALNGAGGKGYGVIWGRDSSGGKVKFYAHRLAWEFAHGQEIPAGLVIDHLCRVTKCVNPGHLQATTQRTNVHRGESPAATHRHKTHCPQGHPYSEANTYRRKGRNIRDCITCHNERRRVGVATNHQGTP